MDRSGGSKEILQQSLSGPDSPSALSRRLGKIIFKALLGWIEHLPGQHVEGWWRPARTQHNSILHNLIAQLHTGPEWPYSAKQLRGVFFGAWYATLSFTIWASRLEGERTSNHSEVLEPLAGGIFALTISHSTEYIWIQLLHSHALWCCHQCPPLSLGRFVQVC